MKNKKTFGIFVVMVFVLMFLGSISNSRNVNISPEISQGEIHGQNEYKISTGNRYVQSLSIASIPATPALDPIVPNPNIDGTVIIRWTRTVQFDMFRNGYEVYRSTNNGAWIKIKETTGTAYKDENLANGDYVYKVRAFEGAFYSVFSNVRTVSVKQYVYVPPIPVETTISPIIPNPSTDGIILVKWGVISDASGYELYGSSDGVSYTLLASIPFTVSQGPFTFHYSQALDGTYYYKVICKGVYGDSGFSNVESVIVATLPPEPILPPATSSPINTIMVLLVAGMSIIGVIVGLYLLRWRK
ncbi:hypothetical protein LCGC14_1124530 [marine sediment metagenome]|uniref:Fibronectin type-III domain-containing protein n=1 Tax=marine sediment metagenome TaxID=412755 RepID=A0A0F9PL14_9ZZZZ